MPQIGTGISRCSTMWLLMIGGNFTSALALAGSSASPRQLAHRIAAFSSLDRMEVILQGTSLNSARFHVGDCNGASYRFETEFFWKNVASARGQPRRGPYPLTLLQ